MKTKNGIIAALLSAAFCAAAGAADYSRMYVFGDSLSDVGNVHNTQQYNDGGRWSNGKVWNEYLAERLGMEVPANSKNYIAGETPEAGNTNFAYGGAMTSHGTTEAVIPSVHQQIDGRNFGQQKNVGFDRYGVSFGENDLVLLWGGANNFFFSGQTLILEDFEGAGNRAARNMADNIGLLIENGAKNIVVINLPDIGKTPAYLYNEEGAANATLFTNSFNDRLAADMADIKSDNPDILITEVDAYGLFNAIMEDPLAYGFWDTTDQLIFALSIGTTVPSDKYLFYDDVHPTTAGHKVIADAVYAAIIPEPSAYAAIFGALAFGFGCAYRRRK